MSDPHPDEVTEHTSDPTKDPQPQSQVLGTTSIYKQCHADDRKKQRYRKFAKAPIWIEAACAIALVAITWTYTHYAGGQLDVMVGDQRPWIGAPEEARIEYIDPETVSITLIFRNAGKTPPNGLYIDAELVLPHGKDWWPEVNDFCIKGRDYPRSYPAQFRTFSVIPGGAFTNFDFPTGKFHKVKISALKPNTPLIGCVVYGSRFDQIPHSTGFLVSLTVTGDKVVADKILSVAPD